MYVLFVCIIVYDRAQGSCSCSFWYAFARIGFVDEENDGGGGEGDATVTSRIGGGYSQCVLRAAMMMPLTAVIRWVR